MITALAKLSEMKIRRDSLAARVAVLVLACAAAFYVGSRWSDGHHSRRLVFFSGEGAPRSPYVALSPNAGLDLNVSALIASAFPPPSPSPPPPPAPETFGIVGENGEMTDDFRVGELDPDIVADMDSRDSERGNDTEDVGAAPRVSLAKFSACPANMSEYIPCLDNVEEIRKLKSYQRGEKFERHCPSEKKGLDCVVPAPKGYRTPIQWPRSRDEVWFSNVPHTRLVEDKGGQNWIMKDENKFKFPGGGTQFIHGADKYLDQITEMVPDIAFGKHTRVALDVGCGVASFGAFLLSRNVLTLSIAPKDVHENQIQFALERGVPAMVAAFVTRRLLYPSQAFDFIHCSRCRINWTRDDGILLLEVNRMLRAGGYFAWAAQPVYKHEESQQEAWKEMENLTSRICWELVKKEGYIAIWRKPLNNTCCLNRNPGTQPPLCDPEDDPDRVWYVDLKACISQLPSHGGNVTNVTDWPARLSLPPARLQNVKMDADSAKIELFKAEMGYWNEIVQGNVRVFHWENWHLRNVMDMRAGFGGFAAALISQKIDCWVMNVVPVSEPNTLPVIYDRGLIGVAHDWCEPFDTYPRTYDLLHAAGLFSKEKKRCNISSIILEMDRMLRPGGRVYIRDLTYVVEELKPIADAVGWRNEVRDTEEGPYASRKVLMSQKPMHR